MKKALIVANWKSYVGSSKNGLALLKETERALPRGMSSTVVLCPPALLVAYLRSTYKGSRINFGTQDISIQSQGAHTGETTGELAYASGATYTIVGHAERRAQGESSGDVALKIRRALDTRLTPIVCLGEKERDKGAEYLTVIETMLTESLKLVSAAELKKIVIAYEPVWAIGAPTAPGPRVVSEAVLYIRKLLMQLYGRDAALKVKILYGGAVDSENASTLLNEGNANGFLVGRASVDAANFVGIIRACESKVSRQSSTS